MNPSDALTLGVPIDNLQSLSPGWTAEAQLRGTPRCLPLTCQNGEPLFLLSHDFFHKPFALNCHQQSPVNAHMKMAGQFTFVTSSLALSHSLQGTLLASTFHHSQFSVLHLKSLTNTDLCTYFPSNPFTLPLYYLSKISEYSPVSFGRNNVPVLPRKCEQK